MIRHSFVLVAAFTLWLPSSSSAAIITNASGGAGFHFFAVGTDVNSPTSINETVSENGNIAQVIGSGGMSSNSTAAANTFSLDTKLLLTTNGGDARATHLQGQSVGSFNVYLDDLDYQVNTIPGYGPAVITTVFEWGVVGELAPGATAAMSLSNAIFNPNSGNVLSDSSSKALQFGQDMTWTNTGSEAMAISFHVSVTSQRWYDFYAGTMAVFVFDLSHPDGTEGTSWIGFSDPGTYNEVTSPGTVPEPATLAIWSLGAVVVAAVYSRRKT